MALPPTDLPSTVEETLTACPQFRILVVGKSGVGKSSLISSIFNISLTGIDIAHGRVGRADVEFAYTSDENPRFILHDSQGFEPGRTDNWKTVEKFLRTKNAPTAELKDRVHAIWLCIEMPRTGAREQETGGENILSVARELKIPIIAVFTKFDLLVNEHHRKARKRGVLKTGTMEVSQRTAEEDFKKRIEPSWLQKQIPCVRISTKLNLLHELTEITYHSLPVEEEPLLSWVVAQQESASQKVDESIRQGCKKYWINLGQSVVFRDHRLIDCLSRIYQDILKVWNFNDPNDLLSTGEFFHKTIHLVQEFSPDFKAGHDDQGSPLTYLLKFLYQTYKAIPATAQYLGAYIIDVTLLLHGIFTATLHIKPPRIVLASLIDERLGIYRESELARTHLRVRDISVTAAGFERRIAGLIRELLQENSALN